MDWWFWRFVKHAEKVCTTRERQYSDAEKGCRERHMKRCGQISVPREAKGVKWIMCSKDYDNDMCRPLHRNVRRRWVVSYFEERRFISFSISRRKTGRCVGMKSSCSDSQGPLLGVGTLKDWSISEGLLSGCEKKAPPSSWKESLGELRCALRSRNRNALIDQDVWASVAGDGLEWMFSERTCGMWY